MTPEDVEWEMTCQRCRAQVDVAKASSRDQLVHGDALTFKATYHCPACDYTGEVIVTVAYAPEMTKQ